MQRMKNILIDSWRLFPCLSVLNTNLLNLVIHFSLSCFPPNFLPLFIYLFVYLFIAFFLFLLLKGGCKNRKCFFAGQNLMKINKQNNNKKSI